MLNWLGLCEMQSVRASGGCVGVVCGGDVVADVVGVGCGLDPPGGPPHAPIPSSAIQERAARTYARRTENMNGSSLSKLGSRPRANPFPSAGVIPLLEQWSMRLCLASA